MYSQSLSVISDVVPGPKSFVGRSRMLAQSQALDLAHMIERVLTITLLLEP